MGETMKNRVTLENKKNILFFPISWNYKIWRNFREGGKIFKKQNSSNIINNPNRCLGKLKIFFKFNDLFFAQLKFLSSHIPWILIIWFWTTEKLKDPFLDLYTYFSYKNNLLLCQYLSEHDSLQLIIGTTTLSMSYSETAKLFFLFE